MKRIIAIVCALALMFSLTACGGGAKADDTVNNFCAAMKAFDIEGMQKLVSEDLVGNDEMDLFGDDSEEMKPLYDAIKEWASKLKYSVAKSEVNGDEATVTVNFTYVDASEVIAATMEDYFMQVFALAFTDASEEDFDALLGTVLNEKIASVETGELEATVEFKCVRKDGAWLIGSIPENLYDVVSCNIINALDDVMGGMFDDMDIDGFEDEGSQPLE